MQEEDAAKIFNKILADIGRPLFGGRLFLFADSLGFSLAYSCERHRIGIVR
jgi:hypothetical protein